MRILLLAISLFLCSIAKSTTYYVSPTGSDSNPGTLASPFKTIGKLSSVLNAGDIAYIRGGTYTSTAGNAAGTHFLIQNLTGTSANPIKIWAYPGETPMFDCSNITPTNGYPFEMIVSNCSYVHVKGFTIKNLKQIASGNGVSRGFMFSNSDHCTAELLNVFNIGGTGVTLENSNNCTFLNCDSHHNGDGVSPDTWNFGDGFTCTGGDPSTDIWFEGCRAWMNGDDNWDFFAWSGMKVTIKNCWSFWASIKPWGINGTQPDEANMTPEDATVWAGNNSWHTSLSSGEGFKLGGFNVGGPGPVGMPTTLKKFLINCVSFENSGTGYSENMLAQYSHQMSIVNCIAFNNGNDGFGFGVGRSIGIAHIFKNNWAWNNNKLESGADWVYDGLPDNVSNNYWASVYAGVSYGNLSGSVTTSAADFQSTTSAGVTGARQADGSLPVINFLKLKTGSDLIDKGVNVGLPFSGTLPDLGAFEFGTAVNTPPTANAGTDQNITLPTITTTLSGSGTDPDGTISSYSWRQVSGPGLSTLLTPLSALTTVSSLIQGVYKFELTVTDNAGATDLDTMQVTVSLAANQSPTANAGADQNITLPANSINLSGSGTDPDGTISAYLWTKVSGPTTFTITNANTASTTVTGLVQGTYKFELKVTDNNGATDTDTMQVIVNAVPNQSPTADAGPDQNITLPTNTVTLSGSGTDPDGTITAYLWTKISGPTTFTITNANAASTTVTGLVQGTYSFRLRVTDNSGATDLDTMQVVVNAAPNQAPTANAGTDQTITLPTNSVTLSGSGTDPDGTISAYLWTKISGPTTFTITNPTSATTSVTGLVQGVYVFQLRVTDNSGATDTDSMQVTVNAAPNQAPTANAGLDQNITLPTNTVSLNGSGTDPDGTISAYLWTKVSGPATFTIANANAAATSVTGLLQGTYQFELKVTDNSGATDTDTIQVTVNAAPNQSPTANAGTDQNITLPTNSVTLSGSGTDPDGTISAYLWTKISGPTTYTITNPTSATTSVTGLVQGVYVFQLRVTDNSGATATDQMQVTVNAAPNQAPTANAGLDQNITLPTNSVSLNGSGTDPDGTISAYLWTKISGPTTFTITNATSATTSVTGLVQGVYVFQLRVTDNSGATDTDTMQVTVNPAVNQPPTANAGLDQNITLPTNSVSLNGSGVDPDGTITAYLWTKISGPASGTITNANSATTSVTGLVQGVYVFQLRVTDNSGATATDQMQVTVNAAPNQAPTANAGLDQNITLPTNSVSLNGSGVDPDGTISAYLWTKISGPATFTITNTTSATTSVTGLVQGTYKFELRVTDNSGATDTDTMQVTVNPAVNQPPTANAGLDQNITLPTNSVSLNGSGVDPDGTISAYLWTKISGPTTYTITNATSATTSVTGLVQGVYVFQLRVTDNSGATATDQMQVTVNAAVNQPPIANAGLDLNITLPTNAVSLNGSGTDPDGTITAYLWTKISGPTTFTITNPTSATTSVTGLVQGVYKFQLRVTDNSGATDLDTMQVTVNPAVNQPPTANAGPDQNITLPTNAVSLNGSGVDPDGTITAYLWTKISGPASGTITNANSATTSVTGLVQGVYVFQLRVTDNSGATATDQMQVTVNAAPNQAPTANAGLDQNITLPTNSVTVVGSGVDPDGTITAYLWTKVSGPATYTITNPAAATTTITDLIEGVYIFQLRVTDNSGATATDQMQVTVNAATPPPPANIAPTANAGADSSIYLPINTITLQGSGTDPDGFITNYSWTVISGGTYTFANANSAVTDLNDLQQGIYEVELTVTDNDGATGKDTVVITVGAGRQSADRDDIIILGNPVQNTLSIEINSTSINRITKIVLFDIRGAVLVQKDLWLTQYSQVERIDMSKYIRGTYIVQLYFDKKKPVAKKVMKL